MARHSKISVALAGAAMSIMAATPAAAIELPARGPAAAHAVPAAWSDASVAAERSRWRHRRHRDNGIDLGDVIAGAVVIGGIAAVASAIDNDRDDPPADYRYPEPVAYQGGGLDRAADMCVAEIERDVRVGSVDTVDRDANGWRVAGSLYDGGGFTCRIGNDGRIVDIDYGPGGAPNGGVTYSTQARGNQWSDDAYAAAWSRVDNGSDWDRLSADSAPTWNETGDAPLQPAYPGGPLPGEDY